MARKTMRKSKRKAKKTRRMRGSGPDNLQFIGSDNNEEARYWLGESRARAFRQRAPYEHILNERREEIAKAKEKARIRNMREKAEKAAYNEQIRQARAARIQKSGISQEKRDMVEAAYKRMKSEKRPEMFGTRDLTNDEIMKRIIIEFPIFGQEVFEDYLETGYF